MATPEDTHLILASVASSVRSPFTDQCALSDVLDDKVFAINTRNIGEMAAAQVIFHGVPPADGPHELLDALRISTETSFKEDHPHVQRFMNDEAALAHAAKVYRTCLAEIEVIPQDI